MKEFLLGLLTKVFNKTEKEIADILFEKSESGEEVLKEGSLNEVIDLWSERVKKLEGDFKTKESETFSKGYKKAEGEIMTDFEKKLRDKYELESEKFGLELIEEIVDKFKKPSKLDDPEKIKLTDVYRTMEKQLRKEIDDIKEHHKQEVDELKSGYDKKGRLETISKEVRKLFLESNPVLSENSKIAENQTDSFIKVFLDQYDDWEIDDSGDHFPVKDGKRAEDNLGHPLSIKNLVPERVKDYYDIKVQDGKGGAGNDDTKGASQDGIPTSFKDEQDYLDYIYNEPDVKKHIAAKKIYEEQFVKK